MNYESSEIPDVDAASTAAPYLHFTVLSGLPNRIRLQCNFSCSLNGDITAYVNGIVVGGIKLERSFDIGEYIDIPIVYFPCVDIPSMIHFLTGDCEIASPFLINSHEEVMAILGLGDITAENLNLDGGLLRGLLVNKTNGVSIPEAFVKLNRHVVRSVILEPPRPRNVGGTISKWAVPIRPIDFVNNGLLIELHVAGIDHPIANYSYVRGTLIGESQQLLELSEKVRQLEKSIVLQVELLKRILDRRLNLQQERLDAFIEYAMALMLDKFVGQSDRIESPLTSDVLNQLRVLGVGAPPVGSPIVAHTSMLVPLESEGLAFGWYDVESNEKGYFRWMGQSGLIRNPDVSRRIQSVIITISQVYGSSEPMLQAFLDEEKLSVSLKKEGGFFIMTLMPSVDGVARGESLTLESFTSGCPATDRGTSDNRILSISAAEVRFQYAERE